MIKSRQQLERQALEWGFLPFFANKIPGFSIEELTPRELWFSKENEGPWDWKGPVIAEWRCAYGKFFAGKAGFVSLDWLPDLLNYRRALHPLESFPADAQRIHQVLVENDSMLSRDLKMASGFSLSRKSHSSNPFRQTIDQDKRHNGPACDKHLSDLMMAGWVCIADFEYKYTAAGERYGWGVARYSTPEAMYGHLAAPGRSPEESRQRIALHLRQLFPDVPQRHIDAIVG